MSIKLQEKSVAKRIRQLREEKLTKGFPFMINLDELPSNKCYLEYPDGSIKIAILNRKENDIDIIAALDEDKIARLRKKYMSVLGLTK